MANAMKKELDKVRRAVTSLAAISGADPGEAVSTCEKVIAALQNLNDRFEGWIHHLDDQRAAHARRLEADLDNRREDLARSAKKVDWRVERRQKYDFVDCFRVCYKKKRVTVRLGSEECAAFDEVNGARLFLR